MYWALEHHYRYRSNQKGNCTVIEVVKAKVLAVTGMRETDIRIIQISRYQETEDRKSPNNLNPGKGERPAIQTDTYSQNKKEIKW